MDARQGIMHCGLELQNLVSYLVLDAVSPTLGFDGFYCFLELCFVGCEGLMGQLEIDQ